MEYLLFLKISYLHYNKAHIWRSTIISPLISLCNVCLGFSLKVSHNWIYKEYRRNGVIITQDITQIPFSFGSPQPNCKVWQINPALSHPGLAALQRSWERRTICCVYCWCNSARQRGPPTDLSVSSGSRQRSSAPDPFRLHKMHKDSQSHCSFL